MSIKTKEEIEEIKRRACKTAWDSIFVHQHAGYLTIDEILEMLERVLGENRSECANHLPLRERAVKELTGYIRPTNEEAIIINRIEGKKPYIGEIINYLHDYRTAKDYWNDEVSPAIIESIRSVLPFLKGFISSTGIAEPVGKYNADVYYTLAQVDLWTTSRIIKEL